MNIELQFERLYWSSWRIDPSPVFSCMLYMFGPFTYSPVLRIIPCKGLPVSRIGLFDVFLENSAPGNHWLIIIKYRLIIGWHKNFEYMRGAIVCHRGHWTGIFFRPLQNNIKLKKQFRSGLSWVNKNYLPDSLVDNMIVFFRIISSQPLPFWFPFI